MNSIPPTSPPSQNVDIVELTAHGDSDGAAGRYGATYVWSSPLRRTDAAAITCLREEADQSG